MRGKRRAVSRWIARLLLGGALGLSACTATQPPLVSNSPPEVLVPLASPYEPAELQAAREKLDHAKRALNTSDYERAGRLAEQASKDAEVAEAREGTENVRLIAGEV